MSDQQKNNIFSARSSKDDQQNEQCVNRTTILKSPFITTNTSSSLPKLVPPSRKHTSPVKRSHKRSLSLSSSAINTNILYSRTRKPLSFSNSSEKPFNLLDDFQSDSSKEKNDLLSSHILLPPPQNSNFDLSSIMDNTNIEKYNHNNTINNNDDRDFFDLHLQSNSEKSTSKNGSIDSNVPALGYSNAYDFNSYLRLVTSNLLLGSENTKVATSKKYSLDLTNPIKIDLNEKNDKPIFDSLELDCVVRSSVWDSDVETEDEDGLDLSLNLKKNEKNNLNDLNFENDNNQGKRKQNYDVLKSFDQSIINTTDSQIPLLYDPINKIVNSKKNMIPFKQIDSSNIPIKIYSDSQQSKIKSPISSRDSDETLHEHDQLKNSEILTRKRSPVNSSRLVKNTNFAKEIQEDVTMKSLSHHHIFVENLKSALKPIPRTLLNMIVESSDGSLEDATKYATEINAQNSQGIPIPEKTTEIVNIPTTGPIVNGVKKSAIIRGVRAKSNIKKRINNNDSKIKEKVGYFNTLAERRAATIQENQNRQNIIATVTNTSNNFKGFYSLQEKQQFMKRNIATNNFIDEPLEYKENYHSINTRTMESKMATEGSFNVFKRPRVNESTFSKLDSNGRKKVNWADSLEW